MTLLKQHEKVIKDLCEKHGVEKLYAFGSVISEKFNAESDIDLLVDFKNLKTEGYADNYFNLKFSFEQIFNREVDLIESNSIRNPFFKKSIDGSKKLIYG